MVKEVLRRGLERVWQRSEEMKEKRRDLALKNLRQARRGRRRELRDDDTWVWSHQKKEKRVMGSELRGLHERMERMRERVR